MSHKRKGHLTVFSEWWKHLRPEWKRFYWKGERMAGKKQIKEILDEENFCSCGRPVDERYDPCCSLACWSREFEELKKI
jgi:hypothetical protein